MTKQVIHQNGCVLQWQDTEKLNYGAAPDGAQTLPVTDEQWGQQDTLKWVRDGVLTDIAPQVAGPTLDDLKAAKLVDINADCMAAMVAGFTYDGHTYDSDLISRTNIIGTAAGVNGGVALPEGFTWRTKDNQNVPMDGAGVIALGAALLTHVNTQYATSWALKAQVAVAENPPDLDLIVWPTAA